MFEVLKMFTTLSIRIALEMKLMVKKIYARPYLIFYVHLEVKSRTSKIFVLIVANV